VDIYFHQHTSRPPTPTSFRRPAEWYHPARLVRATHRTLWWRPGKGVCFSDILPGWPRAFISGTSIVGTETKNTPSTPAPSPILLKSDNGAKRVVRWRIPSICAPKAGIVLRGDFSCHRKVIFCLAWPLTPGRGGGPGIGCYQHTSRPPTPSFHQRLRPTEKAGDVSFLGKSDTLKKIETKN
jgi:hypothetical protein